MLLVLIAWERQREWMDTAQCGVSLNSFCYSRGSTWSDHITGRQQRQVLPDHKKTDRSAKTFSCKVKFTLIPRKKKNLRHAVRDKDLSELRQKRYRKTNPTGLVYERTGQLAWSGEGREWEGVGGIIELQWPYGSTIGEVMCWINSVPDLVFDRAVPSWPPPPRSEAAAAVTHLSEPGLLPARTVIQTDSQSLWLMEHYF